MSKNSNLTLSPSPLLVVSAGERDSLERHVRACARANGVWHSVRCTAESVDSFLSGRVVSMVAFASGLLALSVYW